MIPDFDAESGNLPPGIHEASWSEVAARFGYTARRLLLLAGLKGALDSLRTAGCRRLYVDGSFVTRKADPADFDACWEVEGVDFELLERIEPVLLDWRHRREAQKARFGGELFIAESAADPWGTPYLSVLPAGPGYWGVEGHRRDQSRGRTMITNERQYRISRSWLDRFEQARACVEDQAANLQPRARQAFRDQYDSQIEELREQIAEYEELRDGRFSVVEVGSLTDLPTALIRARVALGLTQRALAQRLGLKEQQIQRYEATRYASASLRRVQEVADALGVRIEERVTLPIGASDDASADERRTRP